MFSCLRELSAISHTNFVCVALGMAASTVRERARSLTDVTPTIVKTMRKHLEPCSVESMTTNPSRGDTSNGLLWIIDICQVS